MPNDRPEPRPISVFRRIVILPVARRIGGKHDARLTRSEFWTRFITQFLPAGLIIAVIAWYFGFLYRSAINVPFGDDIYDVLKVLATVIMAEDKETAFQILYAQHNEHRTLASRLLYFATYFVSGDINFRRLTFLANLALPLLLIALYLMARRHHLRYLLMLPAALVLFQLRTHYITLWSMAAFGYFYVFLYGFYSLYCLHEVSPAKFALAAILAVLATFTLASGQMIWLVGLVCLLHQCLIRKSASYLYTLCWAAIAFAVLVAWRAGLETPRTLASMLATFFDFPGHYVLYTLTLLGSAAGESSVGIAALAGAAMLITLLVSTLRSFRESDLRLEFCCWFVVLSVIAMVFGRAFTSVDYALTSRYSFPSVLMTASMWVLVAIRMNIASYRVLALTALLATTYCVTSYRVYTQAMQPFIEMRVKMFNQENYWAWPHPIKETNGIVREAISLGIYSPPSRPLPIPEIFNGKQT